MFLQTVMRALGPVAALWMAAGPGFAEGDGQAAPGAETVAPPTAEVAALYAALALPEIVQIMREEGMAYGADVGRDLFGGEPPQAWTDIVATIYDPLRMDGQVMAALADATAGQDLGPLIAFFTSEPGLNFVELEVSARRAFLDEELESMANEAAAIAAADQTPRYDQIRRFVEVNDLVETNVVAALNSTYSFYLGLQTGGAFPTDMTEDDILSTVWSQEAEIRATTTEWVYSFLNLAYDPLSDADMEAYIAFSQTDAGVLLNSAIFGAFDGIFDDIYLSLGQAASKFMTSEEL